MRYALLSFAFLFAFSLSAQQWARIADIPTGRHHPVGWGLNGQGYVVTGTNTSNLPTKDFYQYDPQSDTWTTLSDFPGTEGSFAIGVTYQGYGYLGFGASQFQYLNDLWRYDPVNDQWTQLRSCPCTGRRHPAMIERGGKLYVGLGDDASGDLRDWWRYDIANDSWEQLANLPGRRRHHPFQFSVAGEVYAGMGHGGPFIFDDWYRYDSINDQWVLLNAFPGEARVAGTQFSHRNIGYVLSGDGSNHDYMPTGEFWSYDHQNDSWTQLTPHPGRSRWAPGSFVIGEDVFFFGGVDRVLSSMPRESYKYTLYVSGVGQSEAQRPLAQLYPNPSRGWVEWQCEEALDEIRVLNRLGQPMLSLSAPEERIDLSALPTGIYLLQFVRKGEVFQSQRLLLQSGR